MYLHIGENKVLLKDEIVGIFDLDFSTVSVNTRNYLNSAQKEGRVITLGFNLPKSFIVTRDDKIYLSPLNVQAIK